MCRALGPDRHAEQSLWLVQPTTSASSKARETQQAGGTQQVDGARQVDGTRQRVEPKAQRLATVDIAIPVLNEERALEGCVRTLHAFLLESFPWPWQVTIVDNGSTDRTWEVATRLSVTLKNVTARRLEITGKGAAVKAAWLESTADIVAYMDVDLSTDLGALLPLIAPLASGHSDISIGTRLARGSRISRGLKREALSRAYNALLKHTFSARFTDAACGFKAARAEVARSLLTRVADDGWFFDTELLLLAEYNGLRVHEVPVDWIEDTDSRVRLMSAATHNLGCLVRTARTIASGAGDVDLPPRPGLRPNHPEAVLRRERSSRLARLGAFAVVGVTSTMVHAGLYLLLRTWWAPAFSNLGALLLTGFANTEANRRWTFPYRDGHRIRIHFRAGALFLLNYLVTSLPVYLVAGHGRHNTRALETAVLVLCAASMTLLRFLALDRWVFPSPAARAARAARNRRKRSLRSA